MISGLKTDVNIEPKLELVTIGTQFAAQAQTVWDLWLSEPSTINL